MKELLEKLAKGEVTTEEVLKAIDDADKDKVPRSRLNDKIDEVKELQGQLKERDDQLVDLGKKAKDSEELTNEINSLKEANATQAKDYEEKLQAQKFDTKLDDKLREAKVRNPKAAKALLEIDQIKLDGDKLLGLDDQLSALKESDAYLFAEEEAQEGLRGRNPHISPGSEAPSNQKNPWKKDSFNLTEQGRLLREDPTLAQKLQAQA